MQPISHTPHVHQAMRFQFAMDAAHAGKLKVGADVHRFKYRHDVAALLVEPVNEQPFVVIGAYDEAGNARFDRFVIHTFGERSSSGTDFLRARIAAGLFFENIKAGKGKA